MKRRHPKETKAPKNENGSNEIIINLINALTQTVNNKPEKDDVNLMNPIINYILFQNRKKKTIKYYKKSTRSLFPMKKNGRKG